MLTKAFTSLTHVNYVAYKIQKRKKNEIFIICGIELMRMMAQKSFIYPNFLSKPFMDQTCMHLNCASSFFYVFQVWHMQN
jgi:hypothetical protein